MSDFDVLKALNEERSQSDNVQSGLEQSEQPDLLFDYDGSYLEKRKEQELEDANVSYLKSYGRKNVRIAFQDDREEIGIFKPINDKNGIVCKTYFMINRTEYRFSDIKRIAEQKSKT